MLGAVLKQKKIFIVILSVLLIAIIGVTWWAIMLRTTLSTDNAKVAGDLTDVSSKVPSKISKIWVEEGQEVKAGQLLVTLDDSQYKINLEQARATLHLAQATYAKLPDDVQSAAASVEKATAGLAASEANLESVRVALSDAKRQLEKNRELFSAGGISQEALAMIESNYSKAKSNYDAAAANVEASRASLKSAQITAGSLSNSLAEVYLAQVEQAQAAYDSAQLAQDHTGIYAEFDGTVLRIPVSVGENVTALQTLLTICDLKNTWITANIEERKIDRIKVGETVDVSIDAYPGKVFTGKVVEVGGVSQSTFSILSVESTSGSYTKVAQRIPIKIKVDSGDVVLKPGMSALAKIHTQ